MVLQYCWSDTEYWIERALAPRPSVNPRQQLSISAHPRRFRFERTDFQVEFVAGVHVVASNSAPVHPDAKLDAGDRDWSITPFCWPAK